MSLKPPDLAIETNGTWLLERLHDCERPVGEGQSGRSSNKCLKGNCAPSHSSPEHTKTPTKCNARNYPIGEGIQQNITQFLWLLC